MRSISLLCLLLLIMVSCDSNSSSSDATNTSTASKSPAVKEEKKSDDPFLIDPNSGFGQITATSANLQDLQAIYGEESVITRDIDLGEGTKGPGIVIFPDTDNELEIFAGDPQRPRAPRFARINRTGGKWHTAEGLRVGSSLATLREINQHNIQFYAFGWDYGGTITNWGKGTYGFSKLMVRLEPSTTLERPEMFGEHLIKADEFADYHTQVFVSEISIGF